MLLAIDCGNTNIVFAIYNGDEQRASWRISSDSRRSTDEYIVWLTQLMTLKNIEVADIDRPDQAGADRLVNAVAAAAWHKPPAIVIDFGTATTLDLIGDKGAYEGGIIAPGVNLSIEALYMAAARLPRIAVKPWQANMPVLGTDTISAMQSGVFWGYVGMVEGLLERLRQNHGADLPAIVTGGLAPLFADHINGPLIVDADLTLKGLVRVHAQNKN